MALSAKKERSSDSGALRGPRRDGDSFAERTGVGNREAGDGAIGLVIRNKKSARGGSAHRGSILILAAGHPQRKDRVGLEAAISPHLTPSGAERLRGSGRLYKEAG